MSNEPDRLHVGGPSPYDVLVGSGVASELPTILGSDVASVAVICPDKLGFLAEPILDTVRQAGYKVLPIAVPDAEAAKTAATAAHCWAELGKANFTRTDAVVGVGGGAATDLAGFVAATWLRGVKVVHVPTTLLAMVDAAVGGKTGINTDEGKNLVGAFHTPAGVLCDLSALRTLPKDEWVSGMAEVVKAGFIADPRILELVEAAPDDAGDPEGAHTRELITRSIQVKADVVSVDLKETGAGGGIGREMLNYGHTLGHAIEREEHYRWRHGPAVAVGMTFVAEVAALQGRIDAGLVDRHRRVLTSVGLPTSYRGDRWDALRAAMSVDKKSRGDKLRFVVLDALAQPVIAANPDPDVLVEAYARISS